MHDEDPAGGKRSRPLRRPSGAAWEPAPLRSPSSLTCVPGALPGARGGPFPKSGARGRRPGSGPEEGAPGREGRAGVCDTFATLPGAPASGAEPCARPAAPHGGRRGAPSGRGAAGPRGAEEGRRERGRCRRVPGAGPPRGRAGVLTERVPAPRGVKRGGCVRTRGRSLAAGLGSVLLCKTRGNSQRKGSPRETRRCPRHTCFYEETRDTLK